MAKAQLTRQSRLRLDRRFDEIGPPSRFAPPVRGWIRAIREALGMSSSQLATRLGIKQPSVVDLERSEEKGTIALSTLRRAAEALDCTLVYALVPKKPLESVVQDRARALARRRRAAIEQSMLLEDQAVSPEDSAAQLDEFVRTINPARLWDDA